MSVTSFEDRLDYITTWFDSKFIVYCGPEFQLLLEQYEMLKAGEATREAQQGKNF